MFLQAYTQNYHLLRNLFKPISSLVVSVESVNTENIPGTGQPFLLAANHRSDMDPLVINMASHRYISWIADYYLFDIPIVGTFLKQTGNIPISDKPADQLNSFRMAKKIIDQNHAVGIFPEGHTTITKNLQHQDVGELYPGFCEYALRLKIPILPVVILPEKENYAPIIVPKIVRKVLDLPQDVVDVEQRLHYSRVKVAFKPIIPIEPYIKKIQEGQNNTTQNKKENINEVKQLLKNQVQDIFRETVQKHRKKNSNNKNIFNHLVKQ